MTEKRIAFWDNFKGILIFLVVLGHMYIYFSDIAVVSIVDRFIYMFHMPAFVFIAGFFSKSKNAKSPKSIAKLVVIYIIFDSLYIAGHMLIMKDTPAVLEPMYVYWFLIALVAWRLTAPLVDRFRWTLLLLILLAFTVGFWSDIDNTLAIVRICLFYPFFYVGYKLDANKAKKFIEERNLKHFLMAILLLLLAVILAIAIMGTFVVNLDLFIDGSYTGYSDIVVRCLGTLIAVLMIAAMLMIVPDKRIPLLTKWGKNSMSIYVFHRVFVIMFSALIGKFLCESEQKNIIEPVIGILISLIICYVFGLDKITTAFNSVIEYITDIILGEKGIRKKGKAAVSVCLCLMLIGTTVIKVAYVGDFESGLMEELPVYRVMTESQKNKFDNAYSILFAGDLILLEDQVKRGYDGSEYDFSDMFEYTRDYISSADMAIGVFEGPMAGEEAGYTSGNFDDGKDLSLNFPDNFGQAVKDAGFDLVTTANNHVLDKGESGVIRTLDTLDNIGLEHVGSYKSIEEKTSQNIKIIDKNGLKIAVLAYTYGSNNYSDQELVDGDLSYVSNIIADVESEYFEETKAAVKEDFDKAKALNPDLIVVLPHMGTQFSTSADNNQKTWCEIFKECGADIILGDHAHSVQPAYVEEYQGKNVLTAYCPGNFANIYREYDGDATSMIEVYIDKDTKKVIGGSIIPMWTEAELDGNYRALPIYEINTNQELRASLSTYDLDRVEEVFALETEVMLGEEVQYHIQQPKYYFDNQGFMRNETKSLQLTDEMKGGTLYELFQNNANVCFLGDSVTVGSNNGGFCWYEPIKEYVKGEISMVAKGGATTKYLLDNEEEIASKNADLYVVAIGTNDVRYRDKSLCAMTAEDYVSRLSKLTEYIKGHNGNAQFVFIAPWTSTDGDANSKLEYVDKVKMNTEYTQSLQTWCQDEGYYFINANSYIDSVLEKYPQTDYLLDFIHPNSGKGLELYSEAVMLYK